VSESRPTSYRITVPKEAARARLDRFLAAHVAGLSRSRLKALILAGQVTVAGGPATDPSRAMAAGEHVIVTVPPAVEAVPLPQPMALDIVYEDEALIVVDKPPGLVVHPAPGNPDRTLVNALIAHCGDSLSGIGGVRRPGIVHRLDKDTSGLMVVAKTALAHDRLSQQFLDRTIDRAYYSLVLGVPSPIEGRIVGAIGRDPRNRKRMAVVVHTGKAAATRYRVLRGFADGACAQVECRLETGRTHQIRVHMARIGHPVLGDPLYGGAGRALRRLPETVARATRNLERQALHARLLGFSHPITGRAMRFESPLPRDMAELMKALE
jgi:23S rRNA pseudouridine1911/1915/1917 synthase